MEWIKSLRNSIEFIENHLLDQIGPEDVAANANISSFYLQKGFKIMTGYSIGEYIRLRRLYLAALDLVSNREKVIDIAYKYGYDTHESFTKAFKRFHGVSPVQVKNDAANIKPFLPLKIIVSIQGGHNMDVKIEKMKGFRVIGFQREFSMKNSYREIPEFWNEICKTYLQPLFFNGKEPTDDLERAICRYNIGTFGICVDDIGKEDRFHYLIAGDFDGEAAPEGLTTYEFPDLEWAKFKCTGPMPGALQSVNTQIFKDWLPNHEEFEIAMSVNVEWYSKGDVTAEDYESAIWVPIKRKKE